MVGIYVYELYQSDIVPCTWEWVDETGVTGSLKQCDVPTLYEIGNIAM